MDEDDRAWHLDRAEAAWAALVHACVVGAAGAPRLLDGPRRPRAALWPLTQVLAAALHRARAAAALGRPAVAESARGDVAWLVSQVTDHRRADAFTDMPSRPWRRGRVYYDDNAWLGLCLVQGALDGTRAGSDGAGDTGRVLAVVRGGESADGGVLWREGARSRHACSTGPAGQLAARLALGVAPPADAPSRPAPLTSLQGVGASTDSAELVRFAARCTEFLGRLTGPDGLVADHRRGDGTVEPTAWSYNQGTALGLDLLLHRLTADSEPLARAQARAGVAVATFGPDRWAREPAAFMAVLGRNLLALHGTDGDPRWPDFVDAYLAHAAATALDPATGLYSRPGIGRYDAGTALHQAAFVQLHALRAWPAEALADVC